MPEMQPPIIIDARPKATKRPSSSDWLFGSLGASFGATSGCLLALILVPTVFVLIAAGVLAVRQSITISRSVQDDQAEIQRVRKKYLGPVIAALKAYGEVVPKAIATDPPMVCEESGTVGCDIELYGRCVRDGAPTVDFRIGIRETEVEERKSTVIKLEPVFVEIDGVLRWGIGVE